MSLTLMAVHAHPDDEATSTGGVLARYAAEGIHTVLVTCTDGGCGDGPAGVKPGEPGHDPQAVVALRRAELAASCAVLGVGDLEMLGYADSGMLGWPQNDAPGAFWGTPVSEAADRLVTLIEKYQPDVIVTYDPNGFYGHPDHIQAHRITMAAVEKSDRPVKLYWTTVPRSAMTRFQTLMRELDPSSSAEASDVPSPDRPGFEIGLPDDEVTTWVDVSAYIDQKFDALAAHSSQSESIVFLQMGRELFAQMMGTETFVRVPSETFVAETDLFAGLRD